MGELLVCLFNGHWEDPESIVRVVADPGRPARTEGWLCPTVLPGTGPSVRLARIDGTWMQWPFSTYEEAMDQANRIASLVNGVPDDEPPERDDKPEPAENVVTLATKKSAA